jgi:putative DNA primase/helicase
MVKKLTGGDTVSERTLNNALYRPFRLEATFWLHTNHLPKTEGLDQGFRDRLIVLPFLARFLAQDRLDEELPYNKTNSAVAPATVFLAEPRAELDQRLMKEMPGILGRLVKQAMMLLAMGGSLPPPPPICRRYAADYLFEQDLVGQFIEARCLLAPTEKEYSKNLYTEFKEWCVKEQDMDVKNVMSHQAFGQKLRPHVRDKKRDKVGPYYEGISIKENDGNKEENSSLF